MKRPAGVASLAGLVVATSLAVAVAQPARTSGVTRQAVEQVLHVGDTHLPYFSEGTGIPCIVVSSPWATRRVFSRELRQHIRFTFLYSRENVPPDQAGDVEGATLETYIDDIEHLRSALGLEKVCVVGHSIFGLLALAYAQRHPESASHVIMVATPPNASAETRETQSRVLESQASAERKAALKRKQSSMPDTSAFPNCSWCPWIVANAPLYFYDAEYDPSWLMKGFYVNDEVNLVELLSAYDFRERGVSTPIFLALGKYDFAVPHVLWNGKENALPCLTTELFEKSGHFPMLEEQELFDKSLLKWFSQDGRCR